MKRTRADGAWRAIGFEARPDNLEAGGIRAGEVRHEPENAGLDGDITGVPTIPTTVPDDEPALKELFESETDAIVCTTLPGPPWPPRPKCAEAGRLISNRAKMRRRIRGM